MINARTCPSSSPDSEESFPLEGSIEQRSYVSSSDPYLKGFELESFFDLVFGKLSLEVTCHLKISWRGAAAAAGGASLQAMT